MTSDLEFRLTRNLVRDILERPYGYKWSIKGLGCLRCDLPNRTRLHIWDYRFKETTDADKHTHPWHFTSLIVCGLLTNTRYTRASILDGVEYKRRIVQCGPNGHILNEAEPVFLKAQTAEAYIPGDSYAQEPDEIHSTHAINGTVSIIERPLDSLTDGEAEVFYRDVWRDAYERKPSMAELESACNMALPYIISDSSK